MAAPEPTKSADLYPENEKAMERQAKQELHPAYPPLSQEIIDSNAEAMARQAASVPTPTQAEMDAIRDYQTGGDSELPGSGGEEGNGKPPKPEKPSSEPSWTAIRSTE